MKIKSLLLLLMVICAAFYGKSQENVTDYGTFVMYKNPKQLQFFTNEKLEEIKNIVAEKQQVDKEVRWDITEFTYVIIRPKNIATAKASEINPINEEEE